MNDPGDPVFRLVVPRVGELVDVGGVDDLA
jgi:hypothetical protein